MSAMASGKLAEDTRLWTSAPTRHCPDSFLSIWLVTLPPLTNVIYSKGLHIHYAVYATFRNLACRFNTWFTLQECMHFCRLNLPRVHFFNIYCAAIWQLNLPAAENSSRATTNHYFHYQLFWDLFSQLSHCFAYKISDFFSRASPQQWWPQ